MLSRLRRWNHLSVYGVYCHDQSRVYGLYGMRGGNTAKHNLYGLG